MENKYLIAMDSSDPSMAAARYAAAILPKNRSKIVLFLVECDIPESFWDFDPQPESPGHQPDLGAWIDRQNKRFINSLETAKAAFLDAGFPHHAVSIKIQRRKTGVTRDIVTESLDGYAGLFIGRTGFSNLSRLPIGSVARKLISRIHHIPLILVGGTPETQHILLGFDDSHGARICVRLAASLFAGSDKKLHIRHVIRALDPLAGNFYPYPASSDLNTIFFSEQEKIRNTKIDAAMEKTMKILKEKGFSPQNADTLLIEGYMSRSLGLLDTAEKEKWGTIFVGRRGISRVQDFFIGRVGEKLVEMARDQAIWIVA
jgi:nucleotide-binding universal stress UspA family protein